jgi:hypothetical protein
MNMLLKMYVSSKNGCGLPSLSSFSTLKCVPFINTSTKGMNFSDAKQWINLALSLAVNAG